MSGLLKILLNLFVTSASFYLLQVYQWLMFVQWVTYEYEIQPVSNYQTQDSATRGVYKCLKNDLIKVQKLFFLNKLRLFFIRDFSNCFIILNVTLTKLSQWITSLSGFWILLHLNKKVTFKILLSHWKILWPHNKVFKFVI